MAILTKKQQYADNPKTYSNEVDFLTCSYSEDLQLYICEFNGQCWTYKTFVGMLNKREYFTTKYNLIEFKIEELIDKK